MRSPFPAASATIVSEIETYERYVVLVKFNSPKLVDIGSYSCSLLTRCGVRVRWEKRNRGDTENDTARLWRSRRDVVADGRCAAELET